MARFFPREVIDWSEEHLHPLRAFALRTIEPAGITGVVLRLWRTAVLSSDNAQLVVLGILAGAWGDAAAKLRVRLPAIARRHKSGACQILMGRDSYRVRMTNTVSYASDADLKRRAEFVLDSNKRRKRLATRIKAEITAVLKRKLK